MSNILIVGNILKDVYLNLDTRTEKLETDKFGTKWLNLGFNASEHKFFSRNSTLGGAAISLEVLQNFGLEASISDSDLALTPDGLTPKTPSEIHRYIFITGGQPAYFTPSELKPTPFFSPKTSPDYLFLDRSASLDENTVEKISVFLNEHPKTKLVLYLQPLYLPRLKRLFSRAALIFLENNSKTSKISEISPELSHIDPAKIILLSENSLNYLNLTEHLAPSRVDISTHLSIFSLAAATILGCFILGKSVEESLTLARINVEKSRLDTSLPLKKLEKIAQTSSLATSKNTENIESIAQTLVLYPKGIFAADESGGSIKKSFQKLRISDSYENRRKYRNLFFTTPNLEKYISGVILFEETARQFADNGQSFVKFLTSRHIIPGIKAYDDYKTLENGEKIATGFETLSRRLQLYFNLGIRFAKWRAPFEIHYSETGELLTPSPSVISENCRLLADFALSCHTAGIVPIVEPELVYDGNYDLNTAAAVSGKILDELFQSLNSKHINLRACILKTNMILAGKQFPQPSSPEEVGQITAKVLKAHVPKELAGIVFLSGGQTVEQATQNLAAIEQNGPFPWPITFSFARALQTPALEAWLGDDENITAAQNAFLARLIANQSALKS